MEEPRLFASYVDELKLIGPSRFAMKLTSPVFLVRSLDVVEDDDDEPAFDTKVKHRDEIARTPERKSDRPPGARVAPGHVLHVVKRQGGAFQERIGIGRASNVDVRLPLGQVSKYHAYITRDAEQWTITDASSSNGTMVRGTLIDPRVPVVLHDADEVGFGGCRLRFYTPEGFIRFVASRAR
jgi:hypothetical protein